MAQKRKDPRCSKHTIQLCDDNLKAINIVKATILNDGNKGVDAAINYIIEDWYEKNKVKLLMR